MEEVTDDSLLGRAPAAIPNDIDPDTGGEDRAHMVFHMDERGRTFEAFGSEGRLGGLRSDGEPNIGREGRGEEEKEGKDEDRDGQERSHGDVEES